MVSLFKNAPLLLVFNIFFGNSLTGTNFIRLIVIIIRHALLMQRHLSSLIQTLKFSKRPRIVPPEVLMPQRSYSGSLAEIKTTRLNDIQTARIKYLLSLHHGPGNYKHLSRKLYSHFGPNSSFLLSPLK